MRAEKQQIKQQHKSRAPLAKTILRRGVFQLGTAVLGFAVSSVVADRRASKLTSLAAAALMANAALTALTAYASHKLSAKAIPEKRRKAVVDGVIMQWEEYGANADDAIPVVFVHGIPSHPRVWRFVLPLLEQENIRCVAWEQVGFGWSITAGLVREISPWQQVHYLKQWLQYMNIERAIFVGHDVGGGVLQGLLTEEPERALGLVLSDAVAYNNWPVPVVRFCRSLSGVLQYLPGFLTKPFYLAILLNLGHDRLLPLLESAWVHWQPYKHTQAAKGLAQQSRCARQEDTMLMAHRLPLLAKRTFPKTVLWGTKDPLGMASARRLAKDIDANLQWIEGGRHFTPENHPEQVARAVQDVVALVRMRTQAGVTAVSNLRKVD